MWGHNEEVQKAAEYKTCVSRCKLSQVTSLQNASETWVQHNCAIKVYPMSFVQKKALVSLSSYWCKESGMRAKQRVQIKVTWDPRQLPA